MILSHSTLAAFLFTSVLMLSGSSVAYAATTISTDITTGGSLTVSGTATSTFIGGLLGSLASFWNGLETSYVNATSTTATSTFSGGISGPSNFTIQQTSGWLGIGTTTPNNLLSVFDLIDFNNTDHNTKIGYQAGKYLVAGAADNVFVGYQAGLSSSTASTNAADFNTAIGYKALTTNTTGDSNTATGYSANRLNTTGANNVATGQTALYNNTTGSSNSAFGYWALKNNTTGSYNT